MSKKPTTFTEKDRKNYEEGTDVAPTGSLFNKYLEGQGENGFVDFEHFIKVYKMHNAGYEVCEIASTLHLKEESIQECIDLITKEISNASEPPKSDNIPSWDTEEHIWSASQARKRADNYGVRSLRNGLREVMRYVKTAANSGQYECTVYNDNISADVAIDSIIKNLTERGYTVKKCAQYDGWYIKISW